MFFPAIAGRVFLPELADAGDVYPTLCATLLPPGMLGLAIAAMFAATMSTLSGDYNVCASVLTNDVYRRLARPHATQKELVLVGRLMTILIGVLALATALYMIRAKKAEDLFRVMITLFGVATAPVAVPMLLGLVSRRFSNKSAVAGFLSGIVVGVGFFLLSVGYKDPVHLLGMTWIPAKEEILFGTFALKLEIVLLFSTAGVTYLVMELVNMLAPVSSEAAQRTDTFFKRLEAPIGSLPEDNPAVDKKAVVFSPFRIVGMCILIIGAMMVLVSLFIPTQGIPATAETQLAATAAAAWSAMAISGILGLVLVIVGAAMTWQSWRAR